LPDAICAILVRLMALAHQDGADRNVSAALSRGMSLVAQWSQPDFLHGTVAAISFWCGESGYMSVGPYNALYFSISV
jgi:hypothetical protein